MNKVLVVAPHPDDETLGCGGSLLRLEKEGSQLFWLICTNMEKNNNWSQKDITIREDEIRKVSEVYKFKKVFKLGVPSTKVDMVPIAEIAEDLSKVFHEVSPDIVFIPFFNDVHTDHQLLSKPIQSLLKWFRYPYIKKVYMYETLSETNFSFMGRDIFHPNVFIDISEHLNKKIETFKLYESEINEHPFPRSSDSIKALAKLRGSQSGYDFAEAFQLILERV